MITVGNPHEINHFEAIHGKIGTTKDECRSAAQTASGVTWKVVTPMPSQDTPAPIKSVDRRGRALASPRPCNWCGKVHQPPQSEVDRGRGKFCSLACAGRHTSHATVIRQPIYLNDGSAVIPLHADNYTIVDAADVPLVSGVNWTYTHGYARNKRLGMMHRHILSAPDGTDVDHINGDTLDNRRANLRLCSRAQNQWNTGAEANGTSGYKGVSLHRQSGKYRARITKHGKEVNLGYFADPVDAARAVDDASRELYGEFACLNFPRPGERSAITGKIEP